MFKVKLTPVQARMVEDALNNHDIDGVVLKKTVMYVPDEVFQPLFDALNNDYADLEMHYSDPDFPGNEPFHLIAMSIDRSWTALSKKLSEVPCSDHLDHWVRKHTGYEGLEGLKEAAKYTTPTLRVRDHNENWMPHLHEWMDKQGLPYSKV